jgi:CDP-diacylglycerol--serine O-phosphatidyltransferase
MKNKVTQHIPNFITSLNILAGSAAIVSFFNLDFKAGLIFFVLALIFDFLDGFAARALKAYSELGKQLDSIADMISFGFLPGLVMFILLKESDSYYDMHALIRSIVPYLGFVVTVFSGIRLAKFNIDTEQTENFKGLATPANTLMIIALPLIEKNYQWTEPVLNNIYLLIIFIGLSSFMLISRIEMFSLKFKSFSWSENRHRFIFLIISIVLLILFQFYAFTPIILVYIVYSILLDQFASKA